MPMWAEQNRAAQGSEPEAGSAAGMHGLTVPLPWVGAEGSVHSQCSSAGLSSVPSLRSSEDRGTSKHRARAKSRRLLKSLDMAVNPIAANSIPKPLREKNQDVDRIRLAIGEKWLNYF